MNLKTKRLSHKFGVEVFDVDLSQTQSQETIDELWKIWNDQGLVLLRGQKISPQQHIDYSRRFGELDQHESLAPWRHPQYNEIFVVSTIPVNGKPSPSENVGQHWHSDLSYTTNPPMGSLFHCHEVPEVGGDTLFSSAVAAYNALSDTMKKLINDLWVVHDFMALPSMKGRDPAVVADLGRRNPPVEQPLVIRHPVSGHKALYISEFMNTHIVGMTPTESRPLLRMLFEHATGPLFTYRHKWSPGEFIMWDNRSLMHTALTDFDKGARRHFYRTTVLGEPRGRLVQV